MVSLLFHIAGGQFFGGKIPHSILRKSWAVGQAVFLSWPHAMKEI